MPIDIVRSNITNIPAANILIDTLKKRNDDKTKETLYIGYPLNANIDGTVTVDALLVSERYGVIVFIFDASKSQDAAIEKQDELFYQLNSTLTNYPNLRKGRLLAIKPYVISIVPECFDKTHEDIIFATTETLPKRLDSIPPFDSNYFHALVESLQRISSMKPRKKRDNVKNLHSKGSAIKKIEKEIANLDRWQIMAALEMVEGPQRIRGLAGSGKTIVLALKAAYLHTLHPDWEIVITYYTRTLYQQYRDLITKFVFEFSKEEPNWEKVHLFHAWGSHSAQGLYSEIARSINVFPINFVNARQKYGQEHAFKGACDDLNKLISNEYKAQYDIILIDEAQDLPAPFFKLVYKSVHSPKRIVWAYDELQNLSSDSMPSIEEMFDTTIDGRPTVVLKNEQEQPMQDIILPVCYRNPPWILALAHSLGFGIYRKTLVQHFEDPDLWTSIGYTLNDGELKENDNVVLSRNLETTPRYFYDLLNPAEVIKTNSFNTPEEQFEWVAKQIQKNITEDELDPDDILVIFPLAVSAVDSYQKLKQYLLKHSISSILVGVTEERDLFRVAGSVSCSAIHRAKGNEAPMVYILDSNTCYEGVELIRLRNTLFTAITRSRAWVNICGVGNDMQKLIAEIQTFIDNEYKLSFKIPTERERAKMRTINRDRTQSENKKIQEAQIGIKTLIELIKNGDIDTNQLPEYEALKDFIIRNNTHED